MRKLWHFKCRTSRVQIQLFIVYGRKARFEVRSKIAKLSEGPLVHVILKGNSSPNMYVGVDLGVGCWKSCLIINPQKFNSLSTSKHVVPFNGQCYFTLNPTPIPTASQKTSILNQMKFNSSCWINLLGGNL